MLDLKRDFHPCPETVFMLGARYENLSKDVRKADETRHLSLRNIVDVTPPVWVHLEPFHIARRMVSNGEYLQFLDDTETTGARVYDSAGLWANVWQGRKLGLELANIPFEESQGRISLYEEDYRDTSGFLDAYFFSLRSEILRVMAASETPVPANADHESSSRLVVRDTPGGTKRLATPRDEIVRRVFAAVKHFLRDSLGPDMALTDTEERLFRAFSTPQQVGEVIQNLLVDLRKLFRGRVDRRYESALSRGRFVVEGVQFLERFTAAVRRSPDLNEPLALREVLYPRLWTSARPQDQGLDFGGDGVPWEQRPVFGVTLYEAAAYTAWLSKRERKDVRLPNEAQYERASSWPADPPRVENGAILLDPSLKQVFPWEGHNKRDFHSYFGREGEDLEHHYLVDREKYAKLLDETSRFADDQPALFMTEGFGWHWTLDRFHETERKFQRFREHDYPEYADPGGRPFHEPGSEGRPVRVFDYRPNENRRFSHFVLKGSPEVLGGPGLTIRRYAAFPLRAYPEVGFRVVVKGPVHG